jgi:hypothetical protein
MVFLHVTHGRYHCPRFEGLVPCLDSRHDRSHDEEGGWVPVPFVDERCAELLFRKKVLDLLSGEGLLSEERQQLLLSWRHRTGFSADASAKVEPEDSAAVQRLARYILRPPVSLERMAWGGGSDVVSYTRKPTKGQPGGEEHMDALDFLARVDRLHPRAPAAKTPFEAPATSRDGRLSCSVASAASRRIPTSGRREPAHSPCSARRALARRRRARPTLARRRPRSSGSAC